MKKGVDGLYRLNFSFEGREYCVRSKDPKALTAKMTKKLQELSSGVKVINGNTLVMDWARDYIKTYKSGVSTGARKRMESMLKNYIDPEIGRMKLRDVRPVHCQNVLNTMQGKATDTITKCRNLLFNIFESAVDNSLITKNPAKSLTMPAVSTKETHRSISDRERVVLQETCKTLLEGEKTRFIGVWVLLLLYTGLRPGESVALTGADIVGGFVRVNKAISRYGGVKDPKSEAGTRKVPIIPALQDVLPKVGMEDLLFPNRAGNVPDSGWIRKTWGKFLAAMDETELTMIEAGKLSPLREALPPLVPYDLRHTYCTDLERAGVPLNVASKLMGHAGVEITAKIYTHTGDDVLTEAALKLTEFTDVFTDVSNKPVTGSNGQFTAVDGKLKSGT
jgi:integrase